MGTGGIALKSVHNTNNTNTKTKPTNLDTSDDPTHSNRQQGALARRARTTERQRGRQAMTSPYANIEYQRNRRTLLADNPRCAYCPAPATTADHIVELDRGGDHSLENLRPACHRCNSTKGTRYVNANRS